MKFNYVIDTRKHTHTHIRSPTHRQWT